MKSRFGVISCKEGNLLWIMFCFSICWISCDCLYLFSLYWVNNNNILNIIFHLKSSNCHIGRVYFGALKTELLSTEHGRRKWAGSVLIYWSNKTIKLFNKTQTYIKQLLMLPAVWSSSCSSCSSVDLSLTSRAEQQNRFHLFQCLQSLNSSVKSGWHKLLIKM